MAGLFDMSREDFMAALPELAQQGLDADDLLRAYNAQNDATAGLQGYFGAPSQGIEDSGRARTLGGLLSYDPEAAPGMDRIRSMDFEPRAAAQDAISGLLGAGQNVYNATAGRLPAEDVQGAAFDAAGLAMGLGAASAGRGLLDYDPSVTRVGAGKPSDYTVLGKDYFDAANPDAGKSFDPALNTPWSTTKHQKDPSLFSTTGTSGGRLLDPQIVAPSDIQGRDMFFATGDRTARDRIPLTVGDLKLPGTSRLEGGPRYMDDPETGAWASAYGAIVPKTNVFNQYKGLLDPLLAALPMGERSGDFSKHMTDVYTDMIDATVAQRSNSFRPDLITDFLSKKLASGKDRIASDDILSAMPEFGTPEFNGWIRGLDGSNRAKVIKALDSSKPKEWGAPDVAEARFAITEPELINADVLGVGYRMATPDIRSGLVPAAHPSYSHDMPALPGTQSMSLGEVLPFNIGAPDLARDKLKPGQYTPLPKDIKSLMGNPKLRQPLNQEWVDTAEQYLSISRGQGKHAADIWARGLLEDYWRSK